MSRRVCLPLAFALLGAIVVGLPSLPSIAAQLGRGGETARAGVDPAVDTAPWIRYGVKATVTTVIPPTIQTVAALPLPAGKYAITATFWLRSTTTVDVECYLSFGGNDTRLFQAEVGKFGDSAVTMLVAGSRPKSSSAKLRCGDGDGGPAGAVANDLRMTAIRAGTLSVVTMP
jgi:hypothetical protein